MKLFGTKYEKEVEKNMIITQDRLFKDEKLMSLVKQKVGIVDTIFLFNIYNWFSEEEGDIYEYFVNLKYMLTFTTSKNRSMITFTSMELANQNSFKSLNSRIFYELAKRIAGKTISSKENSL